VGLDIVASRLALCEMLYPCICSSSGNGRTEGWKLNVCVGGQPSHCEISRAFESEVERATIRMGRSVWEAM